MLPCLNILRLLSSYSYHSDMYKAWDRKMCNNYDTQDDREGLFNTLLVVVNLSFKFVNSFLFLTN